MKYNPTIFINYSYPHVLLGFYSLNFSLFYNETCALYYFNIQNDKIYPQFLGKADVTTPNFEIGH